MRANLTSLFTAIAAAALIAGCASTTSEDQTPAPVTGPGGGKPGAVTTSPVKPVDVTGTPGPGEADPRVKQGPLAQRSIYYDLDKFDIKDEYRGMVESHAKYLRENPAARMLIQGNTDERGSREYNVGLGQRRADGVKRMLTLLGARDNQIESVSLGEEKPQAEGHNEEAWSKNRRSDMLYSGEF
ncbi:MAG TPA: peptidoglycan-associated lipoprotein Pal [Burkholderiales bacterium]|jgi:peptidoglycan-associated lipoprotein